ncbi:hypothetical protein EOM60_00585 [Candidatus Saccharibacteria bacterium]|nr:hypothetical protein [Candidatus Saccharibacteria bacterium]
MTDVLNSDNFHTYRLKASDSGEIEDPKTRNLTTAIAQQVIALLNANRDSIEGPNGEQLDIPGIDESTTIEGARKRLENVMKHDGGRLAIYLTYEIEQAEDDATEEPIVAVVIGQETPADQYPNIKNDFLRRLLYLSMARSRAPELRIFGFGSEISDKETEQMLFEDIIDGQVGLEEARNIYPQRITMVESGDNREPSNPKRPRRHRMSARLSNTRRFTSTFLERYGKYKSEAE